jgi:hypothetical protein
MVVFTAKAQRRKERPQRGTLVKIINSLNFMGRRIFIFSVLCVFAPVLFKFCFSDIENSDEP